MSKFLWLNFSILTMLWFNCEYVIFLKISKLIKCQEQKLVSFAAVARWAPWNNKFSSLAKILGALATDFELDLFEISVASWVTVWKFSGDEEIFQCSCATWHLLSLTLQFYSRVILRTCILYQYCIFSCCINTAPQNRFHCCSSPGCHRGSIVSSHTIFYCAVYTLYDASTC